MQPFHLAFPVTDLKKTREFYEDLLGCTVGRTAERWIDFNFWGSQISAHLVDGEHPDAITNAVDGKKVPVKHFGAILEMDEWKALAEKLSGYELKLIYEPGRAIMANAGILVTEVEFLKENKDRNFAIVDAAMNDLIRPTLYDADHEIWPVSESLSTNVNVLQDVVGPICETGDYLAQNRYLPVFRSGDLMAVLTAGANGAGMASTYNSRLMIPEILVKENMFAVVRPRPTYDHLIGLDCLPSWLS